MKREEIQKVRDELYESIPTGKIDAFDLVKAIQAHIGKLDEWLDEPAPMQPVKSREEVLQKYLAGFKGTITWDRALEAMEIYASQFPTGYSREQMEELKKSAYDEGFNDGNRNGEIRE